MADKIAKRETPEERELNKKRAELTALEAELAQRELDIATLQAEIHAFERQYLRIVGVRYAELDEIEAQIAEVLARFNPSDKKAKKQAAQARAQAQESAQTVGAVEDNKRQNGFKPSEELKRLYREVAKRIHPDLAADENERARRHGVMSEVNRAYEEGDKARLEAVLNEWESSPESVKGEGIGVELIRIIRKIAQVERRMGTIEVEISQLKESDFYKLKIKVEEAEKENRDLLAEMAELVEEDISAARKRLADLVGKKSEV